jgi:hypothetical protein
VHRSLKEYPPRILWKTFLWSGWRAGCSRCPDSARLERCSRCRRPEIKRIKLIERSSDSSTYRTDQFPIKKTLLEGAR